MGNILCVGNFAVDHISKPNQQLVTIPGGAAYRVCLGLALFDIKAKVLTLTGKELIWKKILHALAQNNLDISEVVFRDQSIEFLTRYDENNEIVDFQTKNGNLMNEFVNLIYDFRYDNYDLIHICPFEAQDQVGLIERVASYHSTVSTMIHYSSLNHKSRPLYLKILPFLSLLFLNQEEAKFLIGQDKDWEYCGNKLSEHVRDGVVITLAEHGSAAFRDGHLVYWCPPLQLEVINTLGAGDCFVGGALSGWVLSKDLKLALRYGSLTSGFPLTSKDSSSLLSFLESNKRII